MNREAFCLFPSATALTAQPVNADVHVLLEIVLFVNYG